MFYALVPGLSLILLLRNGFVRDLYPPERSQRGRLLLLGTACYFLGFVALIMAGASAVAVASDLLAGGDPERRVRDYITELS